MKIALIWHGQTRELLRCISKWKLFIDHCSPDIFAHTWSPLTFDLNSLGLKSLLIEEPNNFDEYKHGITEYESSALNVLPQMYSIYQANQLRRKYESEHNFNYDWIIRSRFDLSLHDPKIIFEHLDPAYNYVANNHWTHHHGMFDDNLMVSSGEHDHINSRLFGAATNYIINKKVIPSGEQLLSSFIKDNSWLPPIIKQASLDFTLARNL
jgi:hypothetical protein